MGVIKMCSKRYLQIFFLSFTIFISYHLIIWYLFTSKIFDTGDKQIGDLARMSYQVDALFPRKTETKIKFKHINKDNYKAQQIDVITIGDSFFNAGAGGLNPYFQDYLAKYTKKNILNIQLNGNSMDVINILINSGWLEKIKPTSIIIESVGRKIVPRFSYFHDFNKTLDISEVDRKLFNKRWDIYKQDINIISTANYKLPFYSILYHYKVNAHKNVYKLNLNQEMFSIKNYNKLLVYRGDIEKMHTFTNKNIESLNNNFNKLALKLQKLNIRLYFMPIVDKYDLYYDYIENNQYSKNNFFEILRPMKKSYHLIDTKDILLPLLESNTKDVFYSDDTHWSYIASDIVAKTISKEIK